MPPPLPQPDLDQILTSTAPLWPELRDARLFLTGGTGFFGTWLTESFLHINQILHLNATLTVLTRTPRPSTHPALHYVEGDIRSFAFPPGRFTHILHAATPASALLLEQNPAEMRSIIVEGTRHLLAFAAHAQTEKLLFVSSGAVYGPQPPTLTHLPEDHPCTPTTTYGEGKLTAERLCHEAAAQTPSLEIKIARPFAFLGPHLPLHTHFAAGNFLADALAGRPIRIASDGTALRSFLYAADLATQLWTTLFRAPPLRPYNIGSEEPISIAALAHAVARQASSSPVEIALPPTSGEPPQRYIPSTARAEAELNLRQTVFLDEAIRRTLAWHRLESSTGPS